MNEKIKESNKKYGTACIGNVIRILDDRTLVVNIGKSILNVNSIIHVYSIEKTLYDVDGSILCPFEYIKDTLHVIQVEAEYSVCKKQETKTNTLKAAAFAISPLFEKVEYVSLNIDVNDIEPLEPINPNIKIGDPIKLA